MRSADRARRILEELGLPGTEESPPPPSTATFRDGAAAGIEVAGIQGPEELQELLGECDRLGIPGPSRVIQTRGMARLTEDEVRAMVLGCAERGIGVVASIGPRASQSRSRYALGGHGGRLACRAWGVDQLAHALEDALRSVDLGVRGLLVYDEGLLEVLAELRRGGELPPGLRFKASIALGVANPAHARVLERLGADSVNPVSDLPPPVLAAIRAVIEVPVDVHVDDAPEAGGPDRLAEIPDIVSAAAPVFLKCGSLGPDTSPRGKARRLARVLEAFEVGCPELELLEAGAPECAVPARGG